MQTSEIAAAQSVVPAGHWLDQADLFYCLAQAFLPPPDAWTVSQWAAPLRGDLRGITSQLGVDLAELDAALTHEEQRHAATIAQTGQADAWLVEYSRLFLVPPVPVTLNAGVYLDGALGGSSVQMMLSCYQSVGIAPRERFRDLPDHVSMQLEFVGMLYEKAARGDPDAAEMAGEFIREFIRAWMPSLEHACQSVTEQFPAARVFVALCRLLDRAMVTQGN